MTNPPQIKRHLGLRTTGQLFPTTQQENYCDWPIPKWGCLIGGICCIPLLTRGEIWTNTKNPAFGKKGLSNWGVLIDPVLTLSSKNCRLLAMNLSFTKGTQILLRFCEDSWCFFLNPLFFKHIWNESVQDLVIFVPYIYTFNVAFPWVIEALKKKPK